MSETVLDLEPVKTTAISESASDRIMAIRRGLTALREAPITLQAIAHGELAAFMANKEGPVWDLVRFAGRSTVNGYLTGKSIHAPLRKQD